MVAWSVFLGGRDLEMAEIAALLAERKDIEPHDRRLAWGAKASEYAPEIRDALLRGRRAALVELIDDLPAGFPRDRIEWIDHHGALAGADRPTSLEQIFRLLEFPPERWTRDLQLVAANDRGHIRALRDAGATPDEIRDVRARDRAAQGITPEEEAQGREAASSARHHFGGRLTAVRLPHARTATVTDVLDAAENLLVFGPAETVFFGTGQCIEALRKAYPEGWFGGELPERGYWGVGRALAEADALQILSEVLIMHDHSKSIVVGKYHLILIWPVLLRGIPDESGTERTPVINAWADWFAAHAGWTDPLASYKATDFTPISDEYTYEEIVYFHPFFRDFLMGDGGTLKKDLTARYLTRDDARQVRFTMDGLPEKTFRVERIQLHLMKPCVALLAVGISAADCSLWELQRIQDRLRRIYPPFWAGDHPGLSPTNVTWLDADGIDIPAPAGSPTLASPRAEFDAFTRVGAEPPVCSHWQHFFGTLKPLRSRRQVDARELCYQQLEDERIQTMAYFAVPDPKRVATGDYDRLTFVDDGNDSSDPETYPYNKDFLDRKRADYTYDRFSHYGTTYLTSGYGFTVVGKAEWFFENIILGHFRRHYFRMGLVAHYQRAALLYFSDELSNAIKTLAGKGPDAELIDPVFRRQLETVQMNFLKFRSRAYFPEVTNQLQGQELWKFWFDHLNSQKLFDIVDSTSERITSVLAQHETREMTKAQMRSADAQKIENDELAQLTREQAKLARIATWGLGISMVLSLLGLVVAWIGLYPEGAKSQFEWRGEVLWGPWIWLIAVLLPMAALATGAVVGLFRWILRKHERNKTNL